MDFYPPLFSLKELLHLKASISTFATLPDEQVAQGFAMMGGIARTVLRALSRNKTLKEMRDSIKSKIANLGEDGWRVRHCMGCLRLAGLQIRKRHHQS